MANKTARKKKGRRRGTAARANNDLEAHIASLGLETLADYRAWCRQHGASGATNKTWQERRQERDLAARDAGAAQQREQALKHARTLGLESLEAYQAWCRQHQLSNAIHKSGPQRRKELELYGRLKSEAALATVKRQTRRPRDTIAAIFAGTIEPGELRAEYLCKIHEVAAAAGGEEREALRDLLQQVERYQDFLSVEPALPRLGRVSGNTFIEALAALAGHCASWRRPLRQWKPDSRNARRRFASLARHLLAEYEVPGCMDSVWFRGTDAAARRQQEWFAHVGTGRNIRTADLPLTLSKRMAHCFLQAPADFTVEEALRWAQIVGQGGSEQLVRAVLGARLGESFADEEFWGTVVYFFIKNPMLDPECVGPIVDYIHNQRFVPREIVPVDGTVEERGPLQPHFTMKGRSALKLWRQTEEWHAHLARVNRVPKGEWESSGIGEYEDVEEQSGQMLRWTVRELRNTRALAEEGRTMGHCVASYAHSCQRGKTSIWSLQVEDGSGRDYHMMTVALNNSGRRVTQVRGRRNILPSGHQNKHTSRKTVDNNYRDYLRYSRRFLHRWLDQEGLVMNSYGG